MTDYHKIYSTQADLYHRLVSREDYQGNLLNVMRQIRPLHTLSVVELGAGTGRVTALLRPHVQQIVAFDASHHMLAQARRALTGGHLAVADNRHLPVAAKTADLVVAGWSLAHAVRWYPDTWQQQIGRALAEMARVARPGGTLLLIETLGTGRATPQPPSLHLATYYRWLERERGFSTTWLRTDYLFHSVAEAVELTGFFFGPAMADGVARQQLTILPECTGIWWQTV